MLNTALCTIRSWSTPHTRHRHCHDRMVKNAVLASGDPPKPPPEFDPTAYPDAVFDPPRDVALEMIAAAAAKAAAKAAAAPPKVLKSGKLPKPPPVYEIKPGDVWDPPLNGGGSAAPTPKKVEKKIQEVILDKYLSSGKKPEPPPAFDPDGYDPVPEFDPPVTFGPSPATQAKRDEALKKDDELRAAAEAAAAKLAGKAAAEAEPASRTDSKGSDAPLRKGFKRKATA